MKQRLRVAAVVNPVAGGDGERAVAALEAAGAASVEAVRTTAAGDAADIAYKLAARATPPDIVVAVGGDGTVCEVATGLYRAGQAGAAVPPLLIAPGGTGNSTYRGLWNDEAFDTVAARVLRERAVTRTIDLARIEQPGDGAGDPETIVVLGSGSGLFAQTLLATRDRPEKGRELLMAAALAAMASWVPYPGRITVDGKTFYEGPVVETIVGGFRFRGGFLNLVPSSVVDDGKLDITVVAGTVDMGRFADAAFSGNVYDVPGIDLARGSSIRVERTDGKPVLFEHDGEVMPETASGYDISVLPAALKVLTTPEQLPWFDAR